MLYRGGDWSSWLYRGALRWSSLSRRDLPPGKGMKYIEGGWPSCSLRLHASLSIASSLSRLHALQNVVQNMMERPKPRMLRKILEEEQEEEEGDVSVLCTNFTTVSHTAELKYFTYFGETGLYLWRKCFLLSH